MRTFVCAVSVCVLLSHGVSAQQSAPAAPDAPDIVRFTSWLTGEFDNFQQVAEQKENKVAAPHGRVHTTVTRVLAPALGDRVFLATESPQDEPDVVGSAHVYSVTASGDAMVLRLFAFVDAKAVVESLNDPAGAPAALPLDKVRAMPGCEVTWRRDADAFVGSLVPGACRIPRWSTTGAPATLMNTYRLTAEEWSFTEKAVDDEGAVVFSQPGDKPFVLRRARAFTCWAALRKDESPDQYDGWRNLVVHDQGKRISLPPEAGKDAKYAFELSQLRYSQQLPVMKLAIYDTSKEEAVAYTWTEPSGRRIGINLRWVQVGCSIRD